MLCNNVLKHPVTAKCLPDALVNGSDYIQSEVSEPEIRASQWTFTCVLAKLSKSINTRKLSGWCLFNSLKWGKLNLLFIRWKGDKSKATNDGLTVDSCFRVICVRSFIIIKCILILPTCNRWINNLISLTEMPFTERLFFWLSGKLRFMKNK